MALTLIGSVLVFATLENSMIFFPARQILATPADLGLDYESISFVAADDTKLHGWWIPAQQPRATLLFFHGNAGNIGDRLESIRHFNGLGLSVFIIDYRGYGLSEGRPSEQGTYEDARAALRYLTDERGVKAQDLVVFGRSLGAGVASWLALEHTPRALILESAFTSVPGMAAKLVPFLPLRWLVRTRYDNLDRVARIACPILIAHSVDDELIPFAHGRKLFEAAREPKTLLTMRGRHNDGFVVSGSDYLDALAEFFDEVLGS